MTLAGRSVPLLPFQNLGALYACKCAVIGFTAATVTLPVSKLDASLLTDRSLDQIDPVSFSHDFYDFRVPSLSFLGSAFQLNHRLPGFHPSSRPHQGASTSREACQVLTTFRPQAFSASRRFTPPPDATGLFHPANAFRVHPVHGFLPPCSRAPFPKLFAPLLLNLRPLTTRK